MSIINSKNDKSLTELLSFTKQDGAEVEYGCPKEDLDKQWSHAVLLAGLNRDVIAFENWTWWDVYMMENTTSAPMEIIYARNVINTNTRRFDIGDWVRTSPLVRFSNNCLFETNSTVYVLVGNGTRKTVNAESILSLR